MPHCPKEYRISELARHELASIWTIDRSETIEAIYTQQDDRIRRVERHIEVPGWKTGQPEETALEFDDAFDRGAAFIGAFHVGIESAKSGDRDGASAELAGVSVLDSRFFGPGETTLQLLFMHVSAAHRHRGLGRRLFLAAADEARRRGATRLYVSATGSDHALNF